MAKPRKSEITATFQSDIKTVWDTVTDNREYQWRSDLERIEMLDGGTAFVEYTPNGNSTKFTITKKDAYHEYEFNMENKMFHGVWTGKFFKTETGGTKIIFKETITIPNPAIRFVSYFLMNLKKIQNTYIADLKKKLGE